MYGGNRSLEGSESCHFGTHSVFEKSELRVGAWQNRDSSLLKLIGEKNNKVAETLRPAPYSRQERELVRSALSTE
jgi:hypothetical protein